MNIKTTFKQINQQQKNKKKNNGKIKQNLLIIMIMFAKSTVNRNKKLKVFY